MIKGARVKEPNSLELPSGKLFRVRNIFGFDGNFYKVVETSDWFRTVRTFVLFRLLVYYLGIKSNMGLYHDLGISRLLASDIRTNVFWTS